MRRVLAAVHQPLMTIDMPEFFEPLPTLRADMRFVFFNVNEHMSVELFFEREHLSTVRTGVGPVFPDVNEHVSAEGAATVEPLSTM